MIALPKARTAGVAALLSATNTRPSESATSIPFGSDQAGVRAGDHAVAIRQRLFTPAASGEPVDHDDAADSVGAVVEREVGVAVFVERDALTEQERIESR